MTTSDPRASSPKTSSGFVSRQRFERERAARRDIELLFERRCRELFDTNQALRQSLFQERSVVKLQSDFMLLLCERMEVLLQTADAAVERLSANVPDPEGVWTRQTCKSVQMTLYQARMVVETARELGSVSLRNAENT